VTGLSTATGTTATLQFTSGEAGTYYYMVLAADGTAPTAAAVKSASSGIHGTGATAAAAAQTTIPVTGLTPSSTYKAYIVVEDTAGNLSTVLTITGVNPVIGTGPVFGSVSNFPYKDLGYDETDGVYRAVGADNKTYTSTDLLTWSNNTPNGNAAATWTFGFVGGKFCYSGYLQTPKYFDGTNWQTISTQANTIVFFKGYYYVAYPFYLKRSTVINSGYTDVLPDITFIDSCFAFDDDILSYAATPKDQCHTSINGTNFAHVPGEHIVAISNNGKYYLFDEAARVYESDNWDRGYTIIRDGYNRNNVINDPIKVNNVLYHLETRGTTVLVVSFDGTTWTEYPLPGDFSSADDTTFLKYFNNKIVVFNNTSHKICWADM
jgi:hypothetical protein